MTAFNLGIATLLVGTNPTMRQLAERRSDGVGGEFGGVCEWWRES